MRKIDLPTPLTFLWWWCVWKYFQFQRNAQKYLTTHWPLKLYFYRKRKSVGRGYKANPWIKPVPPTRKHFSHVFEANEAEDSVIFLKGSTPPLILPQTKKKMSKMMSQSSQPETFRPLSKDNKNPPTGGKEIRSAIFREKCTAETEVQEPQLTLPLRPSS